MAGFDVDALGPALARSVRAVRRISKDLYASCRSSDAESKQSFVKCPFMYRQTTNRILRILRRAVLLFAALLIPFYAISLSERLEVPAQWREIGVGQDHARVRTLLRRSGLADSQCEWRVSELTVRCTLVGQHHAAGLVVRFDSDGAGARVKQVRIRDPVYTGPFHMHARLRLNLQQLQASGMR